MTCCGDDVTGGNPHCTSDSKGGSSMGITTKTGNGEEQTSGAARARDSRLR